uniref:Syntaxin-binding protein 5-like n=1 Tax=Heterorhabditis bacteriophora TaxID=37862 RepID=A0A1I7WI39_HETBA
MDQVIRYVVDKIQGSLGRIPKKGVSGLFPSSKGAHQACADSASAMKKALEEGNNLTTYQQMTIKLDSIHQGIEKSSQTTSSCRTKRYKPKTDQASQKREHFSLVVRQLSPSSIVHTVSIKSSSVRHRHLHSPTLFLIVVIVYSARNSHTSLQSFYLVLLTPHALPLPIDRCYPSPPGFFISSFNPYLFSPYGVGSVQHILYCLMELNICFNLYLTQSFYISSPLSLF